MLRRTEREIRELTHKSRWPELVIFDCDGVLVDSEVIALGVMRRRLSEAGLRLTDQETRERFLGVGSIQPCLELKPNSGAPLPEAFSVDFSREISVAFERELKGVEGVRQAVEGLRARVCVASSSGPERLRHSLRLAGYENLFAPNIFSADRGRGGKAEPGSFLARGARYGRRRRKTAW